MPKKPIDYTKTHFYKIVCKNTDNSNMYIGHTTNWSKRKNQHKNNCINPKKDQHNIYLYKFIRDNEGWYNWDMILLDTLHCENRIEALKKEREYIERLKPSLNQLRPILSEEDKEQYNLQQNEKKKQDRKDNPEKYKEKDRLKYEKRRDEVLSKAKEYYENKKDEINAKKTDTYYNKGGKEKSSAWCKKYKAEHPEQIKIMYKNWYENQKEEIVCDCGLKLLKHNLPIHIKRKRHQNYLKSLEQ